MSIGPGFIQEDYWSVFSSVSPHSIVNLSAPWYEAYKICSLSKWNCLCLTKTPSPSSLFAVMSALLQEMSARVLLPNLKVVQSFRTPLSLCTIPYEQLRLAHMFLRLIKPVDAASNCFSVKVIYNNTAPGHLVTFRWGRNVTFTISGLPSYSDNRWYRISYIVTLSMKIGMPQRYIHGISLTSCLRHSL